MSVPTGYPPGATVQNPVQVPYTGVPEEGIPDTQRHLLWNNSALPVGDNVLSQIDVSELDWGVVAVLNEVLQHPSLLRPVTRRPGGVRTSQGGSQGWTYPYYLVEATYTGTTTWVAIARLNQSYRRSAFGSQEAGINQDPLPLDVVTGPDFYPRNSTSEDEFNSAVLHLRNYDKVRLRAINPADAPSPYGGVVALIGLPDDGGVAEAPRGAGEEQQPHRTTGRATYRQAFAKQAQVLQDDPAVLGFMSPQDQFGTSPMLGRRVVFWQSTVQLVSGTEAYRDPDPEDPTAPWPGDLGYGPDAEARSWAQVMACYLLSSSEVVVSPENYYAAVGSQGVSGGYFVVGQADPSTFHHESPAPPNDGRLALTCRHANATLNCDEVLTLRGMFWGLPRALVWAHAPAGPVDGPDGRVYYNGAIATLDAMATHTTVGWSGHYLDLVAYLPIGATRNQNSNEVDVQFHPAWNYRRFLPWRGWWFYGPSGRTVDGAPWTAGMSPPQS